jgi:hypothetical protein
MYVSATGTTTMAPSSHDEEDAADGEEKRYRVQLHEASLLLLAVHDVQGVEERLSWSRLSEQNLRVDKWSVCRG